MSGFIVVVTGGRDYNDKEHLWDTLNRVHENRGPITVIRNGGMTGADALSSRWAYYAKVDTECFGAQWRNYGDAAGPIRNQTMLHRLPLADLVVAFPGGAGTRNCVRQARQLGIEVWEA